MEKTEGNLGKGTVQIFHPTSMILCAIAAQTVTTTLLT